MGGYTVGPEANDRNQEFSDAMNRAKAAGGAVDKNPDGFEQKYKQLTSKNMQENGGGQPGEQFSEVTSKNMNEEGGGGGRENFGSAVTRGINENGGGGSREQQYSQVTSKNMQENGGGQPGEQFSEVTSKNMNEEGGGGGREQYSQVSSKNMQENGGGPNENFESPVEKIASKINDYATGKLDKGALLGGASGKAAFDSAIQNWMSIPDVTVNQIKKIIQEMAAKYGIQLPPTFKAASEVYKGNPSLAVTDVNGKLIHVYNNGSGNF